MKYKTVRTEYTEEQVRGWRADIADYKANTIDYYGHGREVEIPVEECHWHVRVVEFNRGRSRAVVRVQVQYCSSPEHLHLRGLYFFMLAKEFTDAVIDGLATGSQLSFVGKLKKTGQNWRLRYTRGSDR